MFSSSAARSRWWWAPPPLLHFPMDSVIAVTREVLPPRHPIARLVEAHAYLQLPLDHGVCWNVRSVAHNHQQEIYTPFPMRRDDVFKGVAAWYSGIAGNRAYPGFRYPMEPPAFPGEYCRFLRSYYEVILQFCRRVAGACGAADGSLDRWAGALRDLLPGFPLPHELLPGGEVLARALTGFVHSVSVWHSADHHVYSLEPVNRVPQRLRIPLPLGGDPPIPREEWVRPVDLFRQELARRMFYQAWPVRTLLEVEHGFEEPALQDAARDFKDALRACDRAAPKRYIELERIACSIQF